MESVKLIECISTLQGESVDTGKRMLLCRFKKCNRYCKWCDTLVKMRVEKEGTYELNNLQDIINTEKLGLMITGGEPTFADNLNQTALMLNSLNYHIANVETNGFQLPELINKVDKSNKINYIWSPKLFNNNDSIEAETNLNKLKNIDNVYIKIVYEDRFEVTEFLKLTIRMNLNNRIFLMPRGITKEELLENSPIVFDATEEYQVNFSSRQHIIYNFI